MHGINIVIITMPDSDVASNSSSERSGSSEVKDKSIAEKFSLLQSVIGKLPDQEIVDTALNLLVNGKFDLEAAFIIERLAHTTYSLF